MDDMRTRSTEPLYDAVVAQRGNPFEDSLGHRDCPARACEQAQEEGLTDAPEPLRELATI